MFLREKAIHPTSPACAHVDSFIESTFSSFIRDNNLCAGFLCRWDEDAQDVDVIAVEGIPDAPFRGTKHEALVTLLKNCLERYSAPHLHRVSKSQLWAEVSSLVDNHAWQRRALFIPGYASEIEFVFLCFADNNAVLAISDAICSSATSVINAAAFLLSAENLDDRLRVMELYVREVGHDIASSVQAVVSKLRNVSRGLVEGDAAITKVREAEAEIMSAYRVADTLGNYDPDYNIGTGDNFDAQAAVSEILTLCRSEAEERHVELRTEFPEVPISLWGDEKAIQSALIQLVMNAIKYARGSSYVTVQVAEQNRNVKFSVTDRGKPLDEDEKAHMWEFGWRGTKAKELHVNGSGIGLYTVKKVVQAHGGSVGSLQFGKSEDVVKFLPNPEEGHTAEDSSSLVKAGKLGPLTVFRPLVCYVGSVCVSSRNVHRLLVLTLDEDDPSLTL